jgi:hypothetical protein
VPLIAGLFDIEEDTFRPGVIYALKRIAQADPPLVLPHREQIIAALSDKDPGARVFGLELLGLVWAKACKEGIWDPKSCEASRIAVTKMLADNEEAWVYRDTGFHSIMVKETADRVINDIKNQ